MAHAKVQNGGQKYAQARKRGVTGQALENLKREGTRQIDGRKTDDSVVPAQLEALQGVEYANRLYRSGRG